MQWRNPSISQQIQSGVSAFSCLKKLVQYHFQDHAMTLKRVTRLRQDPLNLSQEGNSFQKIVETLKNLNQVRLSSLLQIIKALVTFSNIHPLQKFHMKSITKMNSILRYLPYPLKQDHIQETQMKPKLSNSTVRLHLNPLQEISWWRWQSMKTYPKIIKWYRQTGERQITMNTANRHRERVIQNLSCHQSLYSSGHCLLTLKKIIA